MVEALSMLTLASQPDPAWRSLVLACMRLCQVVRSLASGSLPTAPLSRRNVLQNLDLAVRY
jgi:hypothetical protein